MICKKCGGKTKERIRRKITKKHLKKKYIFIRWRLCVSCGQLYFNKDDKIFIDLDNYLNKDLVQTKSDNLEKLKTMPYQSYLKSGWWKQRRKAFYMNNEKKCFCCGEKSELLHHITYERKGEEKDKDLKPMCSNCHKEIHKLIISGKAKLEKAHHVYKKMIKKEYEQKKTTT